MFSPAKWKLGSDSHGFKPLAFQAHLTNGKWALIQLMNDPFFIGAAQYFLT